MVYITYRFFPRAGGAAGFVCSSGRFSVSM
jgi:hypothetical protein